MLSQLGYQVVAITSKANEQEYLRSLGASEILLRSDIDWASKRPMERAQWAGALDSVGGDTLAWLTKSMQQNGAIASYGNAGGLELRTSIFPFILRGIKLLGVDSAATQMPLRKQMWQRLAGDLRTSTSMTRLPIALPWPSSGCLRQADRVRRTDVLSWNSRRTRLARL
jgi:putative YhdH/YhfP family quinone oxidoreductase